MLKSGTGLLLTLDHQSTITSVRIDLTRYQGVNLELKAADGTSPQDFKVVATADNTGGTLRLTLRHPAAERRRPVPGERVPRPGQRPPLTVQGRPGSYAKGRAE